MTEPNALKWVHRRGERYVPVFGDWYGNPTDGYRHKWSCLGEAFPTRAMAQSYGLSAQGSDDFNIAVVRDEKVVALLWMDEVIDEEQDVLDRLTLAVCGV